MGPMTGSWPARSLISLAVLMLPGCADTGHRASAPTKGTVQPATSSPRAVNEDAPAFNAESDEVREPSDARDGGVSDASTEVAALPTPEEWVAGKNRYKPPGDIFPQVIQDNDYSTISAIHQLYFLLAGRKKSFFDVQTFAFGLDGTQLVISSPTRSASIRSTDGGARIGGSLYEKAPTKLLFKTLFSLLADLSAQFPTSGVRASHWSNRSYRDVTRFEFYFPPLVVELMALSSEASEPERLYVLDLVRAKDSQFWATEGQ